MKQLRRLWLILIPLAFMPSLGMGSATSYGTLEPSDYVMGPLLVCLLLGRGKHYASRSSELIKLLLLFLAWALVSTLTINVRFPYGMEYVEMNYGLLKLAKASLYVVAGMMISRNLRTETSRREFHWTLLVVILVLGVVLIVSPDKMTVDQLGLGYKANNATSVAVAILVCYVGGILIMGGETKQWRLFAKIALAVGIVGSLVSQGRGGWVAAAAGILYLLWASKRPRAAIGLAIASLLLSVVSYRVFPQVEQRMNATVAQPNNAFGSAERNIAGINDGERTAIWMGNVGRVFDHPVLGTGLYHRGGLSGLPWYGSHNFFLQMFLETGLIGGGFILAAFARMWVDAGARANRRERMGVALRAALIAAFVGSMGGEYLYGGQVLLALLLVYAPTGAMPKKILSPALRWIRVNQPIAYQQANTLQR